MKLLALGAAIFVSLVFSKYEIVYLPDMHIDSVSAVRCDVIASDPELFSGEFDRILCEASRDIPYDSVDCFMRSFILRLIDRDARETEEENTGEIIHEKPNKGFRINCGPDHPGGDCSGRVKYSLGKTAQAA